MKKQPVQLLKIDDVAKKLGMCKASIYNLLKRSDFPRPMRIGRSIRWVEQEVDDWLEKNAGRHYQRYKSPGIQLMTATCPDCGAENYTVTGIDRTRCSRCYRFLANVEWKETTALPREGLPPENSP